MLDIKNISKAFGDFSLKDISFSVEKGEYFVLLGPSGVGKTVLLETITGLISPDQGEIILDGEDVTEKKIQKRRMGLVYQNQALFPHLTVYQNVAYGLRCNGTSRGGARKRVHELADDLGIADLLDRSPGTLSVGESQRVALARTLAPEPLCLLLDEPISSLDIPSRSEIRSLLRGFNRAGQTILHVTHDYEEAVSLASRIAIMEEGRIVQVDVPEEIFRHPKSEFIARFIGIRNFFRGELKRSGETTSEVARFESNGVSFSILTEKSDGAGFLMVRSQDVVLSNMPSKTSALNVFVGTVTDIAPARIGVEVTVDIGVAVSALITKASLESLEIECGKQLWVSFKATAGEFFEE